MDFFDSDDEDEAAARRRATKQREFARMRKALLADEKLGKIGKDFSLLKENVLSPPSREP